MTRTDIPGELAGQRALAVGAKLAVVALMLMAYVTLSINFDARLAAGAETLSPDAMAWGRFLSEIGKSGYMFAISGLLAAGAFGFRAYPRSWQHRAALTLLAERATYVLATLAVSGLAAQSIKHLVGRARPVLFRSFGPYHFDLLSMTNSLASFPSGHSTTVFAMAVALTLLCPSLRVPLFTLAAAIAVSRIVVQAHYLSDIVAGGVLGSGSAILVARFFARRGIAFAIDGPALVRKGAGTIAASFHP